MNEQLLKVGNLYQLRVDIPDASGDSPVIPARTIVRLSEIEHDGRGYLFETVLGRKVQFAVEPVLISDACLIAVYGAWASAQHEASFVEVPLTVFLNMNRLCRLHVTCACDMLTVAAAELYGDDWVHTFTTYQWTKEPADINGKGVFSGATGIGYWTIVEREGI